MALRGRDIALAAAAGFVAWGYAVAWFPALRWAGHAFVGGVLLASAALLALVLLTSRGPRHRQLRRAPRPPRAAVALLDADAWTAEVAALRRRQAYAKTPLCPEHPRLSAALDEVIERVIRDFVRSWYSHISASPVFPDEVDRVIRCALLRVRDRLRRLDLAAVLTTRFVPILTAHFRDFDDAERLVRGRKLNRSMTETEELDLAIASNLAFSDTRVIQQDYLRQAVSRILPAVLPERMLASRAASILAREIASCAVLFPLVQMLSDPDTWNRLMESYGRAALQDRSTVRQLRAALDEHASPAPKPGRPVALPRLMPGDSERKFEQFIRAIRKVGNLSDARRFRSEVASQLKRDSQQEKPDPVYLRRLELGKRMLDQRVQHLAAGGGRRPPPLPQPAELAAPAESRLQNAPLVEVLRDPSTLSYFMEYMDRQRLMPLVQFWLVVDGFRNPLEDDGPEGEELPLQLPPWTESDRLDLAQIDAAYLGRPELNVPASSKTVVQEFLRAGKRATPEQYYRARRAILRAQSAVLEEMRAKHFQNFKQSDLFFKALAAEEEASRRTAAALASAGPRPGPPLLPRSTAQAGPAVDLKGLNSTNGGTESDPRRPAGEPHSPPPLADADEEMGDDAALADSMASLDQDAGAAQPMPDTKVVQAMEQALNHILEESKPSTAEDLRASLFGDDDAGSGIFSPLGGTPRQRASPAPAKGPERPSPASLGLVSAASRIGVFEDDDLFGDENRYLSDEPSDLDDADADADDADAVRAAAPGDLGLAEAITALTDDIDKLIAQEAVVDSLLKKAELTNNTAELRVLRKSKASLQREIRRKELQRQQYVIQESDNSLYGRSTVKIQSIRFEREDDGKEVAFYVIQVSRNAGERMPAAAWVVTRRYSQFLELHQKLRSRYPSVRNLDFPRRRVVMKLQNDFLKKRRAGLEKYLGELLLLPEVCRSRELRAFLSQSAIQGGGGDGGGKKDMMKRLYDSVTDGMEDFLGSISVLDQLSLAGQSLISAAAGQLGNVPLAALAEGDAAAASAEGGVMMNAAEAEAELNAFEESRGRGGGGGKGGGGGAEPFVKPICDIFLELFELNRGNNWLRGRAVVVVLHQLLGGTIERRLRENVRLLLHEDALLRYVGLLRDALWPDDGGGSDGSAARDSSSSNNNNNNDNDNDNNDSKPPRQPRTPAEKARTRSEAGLMLAILVPDLVGSVVGRVNAQAASRRVFATLNNARLNAHLAFTLLDEIIDVLFGE
ncbi:hypothetical protein VTH06DRAFT_7816 [Thermothelomyces fergusii]